MGVEKANHRGLARLGGLAAAALLAVSAGSTRATEEPDWSRLEQCARESAECVRLSPITHSRPAGTATGPNSLPRQG